MSGVERVVLVTGASSGIGEAAARALAKRGCPVILVARRQEQLRQIAAEIDAEGGRAAVLAADLTQEDQRLRLVRFAAEAFGPVEVLINNAGIGWYGYAAWMPWATARQMLELNIVAAVQLAQLFLNEFLDRGEGHLINIGSIAGSLPSQGVALYSATKSFLEGYTTALHRELAGTGVKASLLRLGAVKTPFYQVLEGQSQGRRIPLERLAVDPKSVARALVGLLKRPRRVRTLPAWLAVVPWLELYLGWVMDRIGPRLLRLQGHCLGNVDGRCASD